MRRRYIPLHSVSRCDGIPISPLLCDITSPLHTAELSVSLMTRRTQQRLLKFRSSRVQLKRGLTRVSPFKRDSAEVSWPWSHVRIRFPFNCPVLLKKFRMKTQRHLQAELRISAALPVFIPSVPLLCLCSKREARASRLEEQ